MGVKADLLDIGQIRALVEKLKASGALLLDPYPEVVPSALEDKLLYLASSIYGGISPLPLFSFKKGGVRYVLSARLHEALADLYPDLKVLYIELEGDPQYPFTAVAVVLRDLGLALNDVFVKRYVCPELMELKVDDVPLARVVRSVVAKYLDVRGPGSAGSLRCVCGMCEDGREEALRKVDIDILATTLLARRQKSRPAARISIAQLDEEDRAIVARVVRGLANPDFKRELLDLLNRYEV
ncbi:MAG: hypothetical protein ABWJ97_05420 [Thermoproteus sp.]